MDNCFFGVWFSFSSMFTYKFIGALHYSHILHVYEITHCVSIFLWPHACVCVFEFEEIIVWRTRARARMPHDLVNCKNYSYGFFVVDIYSIWISFHLEFIVQLGGVFFVCFGFNSKIWCGVFFVCLFVSIQIQRIASFTWIIHLFMANMNVDLGKIFFHFVFHRWKIWFLQFNFIFHFWFWFCFLFFFSERLWWQKKW